MRKLRLGTSDLPGVPQPLSGTTGTHPRPGSRVRVLIAGKQDKFNPGWIFSSCGNRLGGEAQKQREGSSCWGHETFLFVFSKFRLATERSSIRWMGPGRQESRVTLLSHAHTTPWYHLQRRRRPGAAVFLGDSRAGGVQGRRGTENISPKSPQVNPVPRAECTVTDASRPFDCRWKFRAVRPRAGAPSDQSRHALGLPSKTCGPPYGLPGCGMRGRLPLRPPRMTAAAWPTVSFRGAVTMSPSSLLGPWLRTD